MRFVNYLQFYSINLNVLLIVLNSRFNHFNYINNLVH